MLDCIHMTKIRANPDKVIAEFFEANKEHLSPVVDTRSLYQALDLYCKKNSLNYRTVENCLRSIIEPALDNHIFSA